MKSHVLKTLWSLQMTHLCLNSGSVLLSYEISYSALRTIIAHQIPFSSCFLLSGQTLRSWLVVISLYSYVKQSPLSLLWKRKLWCMCVCVCVLCTWTILVENPNFLYNGCATQPGLWEGRGFWLIRRLDQVEDCWPMWGLCYLCFCWYDLCLHCFTSWDPLSLLTPTVF